MPTPDEILQGVGVIANDWRWLAVAWHLYFGAIVLGLLLHKRPARRRMGMLLALPLFSVSALAWVAGNPFNGTVFIIAGIVCMLIAGRLKKRAVRPASGPSLIAGAAMFAFGWAYPHFLETSSFVPYLYAAPTGLIPCPTLSILIGLTLMLRGLESRTWSLALGGIGIFYGLFGAARLGVAIDWVLLAGALVLVWRTFSEKWGVHEVEEAGRVPALRSSARTGLPHSTTRIGVRLLAVAGTLAIILGTFFLLVRPWYLHWGATDSEIDSSLPGDEIVPNAVGGETRAITINAPVDVVWPWLAQLGQDRAGFYSYELLENIVGCEMPSGDRLLPDRQSWKLGDKLWMYPSDKAEGMGFATLRTFIPGRAMGVETRMVGTALDAPADGSWSFVLVPIDRSSTRLLIRGRGTPGRSLLGLAFDRAIFEPGHFVMERRTMLDLKRLAEGGARDHLANDLQVVLWTVTFLLFITSIVMVFRRERWRWALAAMIAAAVVFQILTLGQPHVAIGALLVIAVVLVLRLSEPTTHAPEQVMVAGGIRGT